MADNQNPGNFANRPKEEVQNIASKGGQTGTENSGFVRYILNTTILKQGTALTFTSGIHGQGEGGMSYFAPQYATSCLDYSLQYLTARHSFPGRQSKQRQFRKGQRGREGGWQEGRSNFVDHIDV